jgi:hypothetical protein
MKPAFWSRVVQPEEGDGIVELSTYFGQFPSRTVEERRRLGWG